MSNLPSAEIAGMLVALGAVVTALVGWYTARNARKGQAETHQLADRKTGSEEAKTLIELSSSLVKSINDELDRVRQSLAVERERREAEEREVHKLREKLEEAENRIDELMRELHRAEERTQQMREQMTALSAELREYRTAGRSSDTRTRFDDLDLDDDLAT